MRLYLVLDSSPAVSNEIAKVEIHYVPLYDLIKEAQNDINFLPTKAPLLI